MTLDKERLVEIIDGLEIDKCFSGHHADGFAMCQRMVKEALAQSGGEKFEPNGYDDNGNPIQYGLNGGTASLPKPSICQCGWEPGEAIPVNDIKKPVCPKCSLPFQSKLSGLTKEVCICAAVVTDDGTVIRGHRHGDCIQSILRLGKKPMKGVGSQGFITSKNRYVNREEGRKLQDVAGIESADSEGYRGNTLFSEDLY